MLRRLMLLGAVLLFAAAASAQSVRVYKAKYRTAEELAPLVASAVGSETHVVVDRRTNALVFSGAPREIASALALLETLDTRARTVVLRYEARSASELAAEGVRVSWRGSGSALRIGDVGWPSSPAALAVGVGTQSSHRTSDFVGQLRILEGQSGRIASGATLPITTRRIQYGRRGSSLVEEETRYATAESGFEASPRVLGDGKVELALRPFDASLQRDGSVAHSGADTVLVLEPGATVALGGMVREESARQGTFSGGGASGASRESLLLVTVEVEP